jgi:hypothetical protein
MPRFLNAISVILTSATFTEAAHLKLLVCALYSRLPDHPASSGVRKDRLSALLPSCHASRPHIREFGRRHPRFPCTDFQVHSSGWCYHRVRRIRPSARSKAQTEVMSNKTSREMLSGWWKSQAGMREKKKGLSQKYYRPPVLGRDFVNHDDFKTLKVVEIAFRPTFGTAPGRDESRNLEVLRKRNSMKCPRRLIEAGRAFSRCQQAHPRQTACSRTL